MRIIYFAVLIMFSSCSKSIEDHCFVEKINDTDNIIIPVVNQAYTAKQILAEKPDYLEIVNLKKYRSFKKDSTMSYSYDRSEESENIYARQNKEFKKFRDNFSDQFLYYHQQKIEGVLYGLGRNRVGFWLLKIQNDIPRAYFLGLSFNHYYINEVQEKPIVQGDYLELEGSLVKMKELGGRHGYPDYSTIEDGKLFKMKLKDLIQDTDKDGYNNIFEESFGLNPNDQDTDGDGINDFEDMNPMFASEKNQFTQLYELLLPYHGNGALKKMNYTFCIYKNNCNYFHQVNPDVRILFVPEEKNNQTYYTKVTDLIDEEISKIQKNKKEPNSFYIYKVGNSYKNDYTAEYKKGKWILKVVGGYVI